MNAASIRMRFQAWLVLQLLMGSLFGQNTKGVAPSSGDLRPVTFGNTWALVAGISDYQNPEIPDLQFAHVDAQAYIDFLKSPAGGNVPEANIRGLINEKATAGQFASALDWLIDKAKEGDQVIIYFSGHGDVEKKTITNPGFLLCWDAPSRVYMGGGTFGLAYLQEVVATLSAQTKARVLVITDACHSGKLAGSEIGGTQATASNLAKQFANEVKLMSCQANELALEGPQWGGGRGVFSYHLLKGLTGLADFNQDGAVSLFEIERYLADKIPPEVAPKSQIPAVFGAKNTIIANVDPASLAALIQKEQGTVAGSGIVAARSDEALQPSGPSVFEKYSLFKQAIKEKHLLYPQEGSAWTYYQELKDNPMMKTEIQTLRGELVAALQDEAQQSINNYLNSDPREISARDKFDSGYEKFPEYLQKAAELLGTSHYLYKTIKARETYFSGLNLRLKGEQTRDSSLYRKAIELQMKALEWEPNAPYIFNELGYLYRKLKEYQKSVEYSNLAILPSPKWLMPRINLMIAYRQMGDQMKRYEELAEELIQIDPNSYIAHVNLGVAYYYLEKWSMAEQEYKRALEISPNDREALFSISFIFYKQGKWEEAENAVSTLMKLYPDDLELCIPRASLYVKKGREDEAFSVIETAVLRGYRNFENIENATDLRDLIRSERYLSLKKKYSTK